MAAGDVVTRLALVVTVKDEAGTVGPLLRSIDDQTRAPDEVVVVDGGSVDGTLAALEEWAGARANVTVLSEPGTNIAAGRNLAVARTTAGAVAVTDGGCELEPHWLERLADALERADVAMGYYAPLARTFFEQAVTCLTVPEASEVSPERFMPSSRSIAFRREVWERAGRYPGWLDVGEDMYFNFRVLESGAERVFVPDAVVTWRPRSTLRSFLRQYYRYARGDGEARMYPRRHAVRFGAYAVATALLVLSFRWPLLVIVPAFGAGAWLAPAIARVFRRMDRGRLAAGALLPVLAAMMDAAKMAGYVAGRLRGRRVA